MLFHAPPLSLAAQAHPQRTALVDGQLHIDYAQLNAQAATLAGRLAAYGLRAGERVAVLLDRSARAVQLVHALAHLGAAVVPLNTRLTADEMRWQVERAGCRMTLSTLAESPPVEATPLEALPPAPEALPPPAPLEAETPFGILFTSGTTGRPKGALLTWGNLFASAAASAFRLGALPEDRWLLTLPLYHIGGLSILMRSALYGSAVVLPRFPGDRFETETLWERLHADRVTLVSLVPTMLYRLLEAHPRGEEWPPSLRLILRGGAAAAPETLTAALEAGLPVAVTYGLSEAASQVATATPKETRRKPGTVGRPLMGLAVRVTGERGRALPRGEIGEIWVRGPMVMPSYDGDPQATATALQDDWLHTGDLGYLDAEGDLWVVQRRSDLIVTGGENVYPAEVEAVLREHPSIAEACVVGIPHPEWGQQVVAGVVLHPGETVSLPGVAAFCRSRLAGYKIPRKIVIFPSLPRTASGKIMRRRVAAVISGEETYAD